ncbi:Uncharacterised protein [Mycobacterium tuberculosis]|nr:Uncharacterised protein [Mycobacterium tuberculosis]
MTLQDGVEQWPELHGAPAHIKTFHLERNDAVVSGKVEFVEFYSRFRHDLLLRADRGLLHMRAPKRNHRAGMKSVDDVC